MTNSAIITLEGEKLKATPLNSGKTKCSRMTTLTTLIQCSTGRPSQSN